MDALSTRFRPVLVFAGLVAVLALSACAGTGTNTGAGSPSRAEQIDRAMARSGEMAGASHESLPAVEQAYKHSSDNPAVALRYARALRADGQINKAVIVLSPFARKDNAESDISSEFAAIHLEMGDYETAEKFARAAILKDATNYGAYQVLGIALDARGYYKQAEVAFRKGLDVWQGDPTPIMNNLALNLINQGLLDEASDILQKANAANPGRPEIERNLRIVLALKQSVPPGTKPTPAPKPGH